MMTENGQSMIHMVKHLVVGAGPGGFDFLVFRVKEVRGLVLTSEIFFQILAVAERE